MARQCQIERNECQHEVVHLYRCSNKWRVRGFQVGEQLIMPSGPVLGTSSITFPRNGSRKTSNVVNMDEVNAARDWFTQNCRKRGN